MKWRPTISNRWTSILTVLAALTMFGMYAGAYYATVRTYMVPPQSIGRHYVQMWSVHPDYVFPAGWPATFFTPSTLDRLFAPIHFLDRRIRSRTCQDVPVAIDTFHAR